MSTTAQPTHVHIFDKGCHQPWYAEFILANYLVVHNDGGDKMRIVRPGCEHPTCGNIWIDYAVGGSSFFTDLAQAMIDMSSSEIHHYLEDALAIRTQEYES
jgi:hypothetical protein